MQKLKSKFTNREALVEYVRGLAPWAEGKQSSIIGGYQKKAQESLENIKLDLYCKNRNFGNGNVTRLSPYVNHGILSFNEIRNYALSKYPEFKKITKFMQELGWRDFWQRIVKDDPEYIWNSVADYKTGFAENDYSDFLTEDIACAKLILHV